MATMTGRPTRSVSDYQVGWICPLEIEQLAATIMLDDKPHDRLPQPRTDHNVYTLGSIHGHNVVIASLPSTGNSTAASVASNMKSTFPNIKFALLVGIGGAVTTDTDEGPIRLGHVVVSKPSGTHSGAIQYDHGKVEVGMFRRTGFIPAPPPVLLNAAQKLAVERSMQEQDPVLANTSRIKLNVRGHRKFKWPGQDRDLLYRAEYNHVGPQKDAFFGNCDPSMLVQRPERDDVDDSGKLAYIVTHRGTIACGEAVIKSGAHRDEVVSAIEGGALCFEMEAGGALNDLDCLVIRGMSDYCDSHKNDEWHAFAALAAASYARELFNFLPIEDVESCDVSRSDLQYMKSLTLENEVTHWLSAPDPFFAYESAREKRHLGTGQWLLDAEWFEKWLSSPSSLLWITAKPGAGKTVLSSTIIEKLREDPDLPHRTGIAFFFFEHQDKGTHSLLNLLASLLLQLARLEREETWPQLCDYFQHCKERSGSRPSLEGLKQMFENLVLGENFPGGVFIVLDALDEIPRFSAERSNILQWLQSLARNRLPNLHLLMTSREEEHDLRERLLPSLDEHEVLSVTEADANKEDIENYIHNLLHTKPEWSMCRSAPDILAKTEATLVEKASGMFRWVECQLCTLQKCLTPRDLRDVLAELPEGLDDTYSRMLGNIEPRYQERAISLLQIMLLSPYPLSLKEANTVSAIDLRQSRFDADLLMSDPRQITSFTTGLTSVRQSPYGEEVVFAHFSVKEYLTSNRLPMGMDLCFKVTSQQRKACHLCLSLFLSLESMPQDLQDVPWLSSAQSMWVDNVAHMESFYEDLHALTRSFLSSKSWRRWLQEEDYMSRCKDLDIAPQDWPEYEFRYAVYYAARSGMCWQMKTLLDNHPIDAIFKQDPKVAPVRCPLEAALKAGRHDMVKLLLRSGADPHGQTSSALEIAADRDDVESLQLLHDAGADVAKCHADAAASVQALGALEFLLSHGSDPNVNWRSKPGLASFVEMIPFYRATKSCTVSLLEGASASGNTNVVKILLADQRTVMKRASDCRALTSAIAEGYEDVVEMLLDRGACVQSDIKSSQDDDGKSDAEILMTCLRVESFEFDGLNYFYTDQLCYADPVANAIASGCPTIVYLLARKGADLRQPSALYAAADGRCGLEMVEYLINNGADADATTNDCTPLSVAAGSYHECSLEIMKVLLESGADCNQANPLSRAALLHDNRKISLLLAQKCLSATAISDALISASGTGNYKLVQMLLDKGADIHARTANDDFSAMHAAASCGALCGTEEAHSECCNSFVKTAELLLRHGADANLRSRKHGSAIRAASRVGCVRMVRVLLENGAVPDGVVEDRDPPILDAAAHGHVMCVASLLACGGNANARNEKHASVLATACSASHADIVNQLLDAGAEVNSVDLHSRTALHAAAENDNASIIYLLLRNSAHLDPQDEKGRTPLVAAIRSGHFDMARLLLEAGSNINQRDKHGMSVLQHSVFAAERDFMATEGSPLKDKTSEPAPEVQVCHSRGERFRSGGQDPPSEERQDQQRRKERNGREFSIFLIAKGADVHARDEEGRTALLIAAARARDGCDLSVFEALIEHGADIHAAQNEGNTVMHLLQSPFYDRHPNPATYLLKRGANINTRNCAMQTPLNLAIQRSTLITDHVERLLESGADASMAADLVGTALHQAASSGIGPGGVLIKRLLLDHGADAQAITASRGTPLHETASCDISFESISLLIDRGAQVNKSHGFLGTPLHCSIFNTRDRSRRVLKALLQRGADVNAVCDLRGTPLHVVASQQHAHPETSIDILVKHGASIEVDYAQLGTPLHVAVTTGNLNAVIALLEKGANPNAQSVGRGSVMRCAKGKDPRTQAIANVLREYGAVDNRAPEDLYSEDTPCDISDGVEPAGARDQMLAPKADDPQMYRQFVERSKNWRDCELNPGFLRARPHLQSHRAALNSNSEPDLQFTDFLNASFDLTFRMPALIDKH